VSHLRAALFVLLVLIFLGSSCSSLSAPTDIPAILTQSIPDNSFLDITATPTDTSQPIQTRTGTLMRSYAHDAAKLMGLVDLSGSLPLSPGSKVVGHIDRTSLAVPFTYEARAGEILILELLLPDMSEFAVRTILPAIYVADPAGNEIGYTRGGLDFIGMGEMRSIAQAGFVASSGGPYTILATLDGHQDPQKNLVHEADFELLLTSVPVLAVNRIMDPSE
jgi:hypothetical protein